VSRLHSDKRPSNGVTKRYQRSGGPRNMGRRSRRSIYRNAVYQRTFYLAGFFWLKISIQFMVWTYSKRKGRATNASGQNSLLCA
jgi:hypothetical protein